MSEPRILKHVCWLCSDEQVTVLSVPVVEWTQIDGKWTYFTCDKRHTDTMGRISRDEMAVLAAEDEAQTWEDGYGIRHPRGWVMIEGDDNFDACLCPKCKPKHTS